MIDLLRFRSVLDDSDFKRGLDKMSLGVGLMSAAVVGSFGAIALAGDKMNMSLARIGAATGNARTALDVYGNLRDVAKETGLAIEDSAGQFSRFAIAARQIGGTNDEIVKLIDTISKAGVVSGASASEMASAGTQIGQALASGKFQGDELKSVMENLPLLMEEMAKQLGVSTGELKKMGAEGELTANVVFPALLKSSEAIEAKFKEMPDSMQRAWGAAKSEMESALAAADKILGVSNQIVGALRAVTGVLAEAGTAARFIQDFASWAGGGEADAGIQNGLYAGKGGAALGAGKAAIEEKTIYNSFEKWKEYDAQWAASHKKELDSFNEMWQERDNARRSEADAERERISAANEALEVERQRTLELQKQVQLENALAGAEAAVADASSGMRSLTRDDPAEMRKQANRAERARRNIGGATLDGKGDAQDDSETEYERTRNEFERRFGKKSYDQDSELRGHDDPRENRSREELKDPSRDQQTRDRERVGEHVKNELTATVHPDSIAKIVAAVEKLVMK